MPVTYNLIASNTLSSSAASVTFSAIPNTYTDLVLKWSVRTTTADTSAGITIRVNGSSAANYSLTRLGGNGATASSSQTTNQTGWIVTVVGDTATANTFANNEYYFANYAGSTNKPISAFEAIEDNATTAYNQARAMLHSMTNAISSITISSGDNLKSGSSFFLYGIKNS